MSKSTIKTNTKLDRIKHLKLVVNQSVPTLQRYDNIPLLRIRPFDAYPFEPH